MLELRAKVKAWEHEFEAQNKRKPTSSDVKANKEVWKMYQLYKDARRKHQAQSESQSQSLTETPTSSIKPPSTPKKSQLARSDSETENDEPTPIARKVTEVFPTPQFRGKALGLFDVELNVPLTPQKSADMTQDASPLSKLTSTPNRPPDAETPQSKRTPDYFLQRVNLFPTQSLASIPELKFESTEPEPIVDSPLIKQKPSRHKSVSELVKEASLIHADSSDVGSSDDDNENIPQVLQFDVGSEDSRTDNLFDSVPHVYDPATNSKGRSKPKRQTRRVIMRPVNNNEKELANTKATENYVRLKINHSGRNHFKRRRR